MSFFSYIFDISKVVCFYLYNLPEIFLASSSAIFLILYIILERKGITFIKHFIFLNVILVGITLYLNMQNQTNFASYFFFNSYLLDKSILFIKSLCLIFFIIYLFILFNVSKYYSFIKPDHIYLMVVSVVGGLFLLSSRDFLPFYLSLEIFSIPLYILVASNYKSNFSTESGLKYFIVGSFSSGLILFGISFLYWFTGTTNFDDISLILFYESHSNFSTDYAFNLLNYAFVGVAFIVMGMLIKIGVAPFHFWVADVYIGAPLPITLFLLTVPKIVVWGVFYNIIFVCFYPIWSSIESVFWICIVTSFFFGIFPGLYQIKLKRLLIYSSIASNGFLLMPLYSGSFSAMFLFLSVYLLNVSAFFSLMMLLRNAKTQLIIKKTSDLNNLYNWARGFAFVGATLVFSFAGIPPLAGFFIKYYLFINSFTLIPFAIAVALLFSCVSTFYYIRILKWMFFSNNLESSAKSTEFSLINGFYLMEYFVFFVGSFNLLFLFFYEYAFAYFELIFAPLY